MSKKNSKMISHDFYCINCGNKGIELMRQQSHQHKRYHRKKLYCLNCKCEVNHIECKTYDEIQEFKSNFENGVYKDEAKESISTVGASTQGQNLTRDYK